MFKNILLSLFVTCFCLAVVEFAIQKMHLEEPHLIEKPKEDWALVPERVWTEHHISLGWFQQKNKTAKLRVTDFEVDIHTNSMGFRGQREYQHEKPEGIRRAVALGDSFVFGYGVKDDETFTAKLEAEHRDLEVLNLGVPGYGIDQILLSYRVIGSKYNPDYVLIGIFPEDFWRATRAFADSGHAKPYYVLKGDGDLQLKNIPVPQPFELKTNQFPEIVEYSPFEKLLMRSHIYRIMKKGLVRLGKNLGLIDPDLTTEWVLGKALLKKFYREIKQTDAEPVFLILPPDRWVRQDDMFSLHKSLVRYLKRERMAFLDMTPHFYKKVQDEGEAAYYIQGDGHWTPKGHQLAADLIDNYLSNLSHSKGTS